MQSTAVTSTYGKREGGMERSASTGWLAAFVASNSPGLFEQIFSLPTATYAKILIISDFCFKWKTNKGLRLFSKQQFFKVKFMVWFRKLCGENFQIEFRKLRFATLTYEAFTQTWRSWKVEWI